MMKVSVTAIVVLFTISILSVTSTKNLQKRDYIELYTTQNIQTSDVLKWFCEENPFASTFSFCQNLASPTPAPTNLGGSLTSSSTTSTTKSPSTTTTTESPSALERAHWCRFPNGTFVPRGYSFMNTACDLCQCTQSRIIRCTTLQCMATYCIDNTATSRRAGQCCPQCAYETNSTQCVLNGITFPHGALIRTTADKVNCWCQLGTVECRKIGVSVFSGLDLWGDGTAVYVVIMIICVVLIIGTLLCGGCSLVYYYYYYYYCTQQATEQAYWENAGWQPMEEGEQIADGDAEKKQAEAEQSQNEQNYPSGFSEEYVPPPYALYNGSYDNEQANKEQKYI